ncbi:hypothetical protein AC579_6932 [Pseudocercospora musae]|uniref:Uncharacterized protein n=1 Tax=Pseudocercospora musae TaxID=113226 RepID=A0A139INU8_9PEZI|nr:hypothetical protein AC579_6932 [Pseudocercospora musae]
MDQVSTGLTASSMSSVADMEFDARMAEDADATSQKSKFWDLLLEIRDMIYGMTYPICLAGVPAPSSKRRND